MTKSEAGENKEKEQGTDRVQTHDEFVLQDVGIRMMEILRDNAIKTEEEADRLFKYAKKLAYGDYRYFKVSDKTATTD